MWPPSGEWVDVVSPFSPRSCRPPPHPVVYRHGSRSGWVLLPPSQGAAGTRHKLILPDGGHPLPSEPCEFFLPSSGFSAKNPGEALGCSFWDMPDGPIQVCPTVYSNTVVGGQCPPEGGMCWCSVPAAPWDRGVKSTHPDRGTHVVKLPGGVGVYKGSGENGDTTSTHPPMDGGHIRYRPGGGILHFVVCGG